MKKIFLHTVIIAELVVFVCTNPITVSENGQASTLQPPPQNLDSKPPENSSSTIEQLIQQQADTVRRIVTDQQQTLADKNEDEKTTEKQKSDTEKISLEDLKLKCQHFFKIYNSSKNTYDTNSHVPHNHRISTHRPFPSNVRPIYKMPSRTATVKPPGFYITTETTTTKKPPASTAKPAKQAIKFIRLEPVILQKTILNDGRTVYYWHHSLPSASVNDPQPPDFTMNQVFNSNTKSAQKPPISYRSNPKPASNSDPNFPYHPNHLNFIHTTPSTTTAYSGLSIRDYFPFYWSGSNENENTSPSTISTTTSTTTTTPKPTTTTAPLKPVKPTITDPKDLILAQQLRFVVPVPYDNIENDKQALDFDQIAYYPNIPGSQEGTVSVQMPFVPAFHMIKAVAVPNNYQAASRKFQAQINNEDYNVQF